MQDGGWASRTCSGRPAHPLPALQRAHGQSNQHCTKPMNASPPFALLHTSRPGEFRSPCNTLAYSSPDTLPHIHRGCAIWARHRLIQGVRRLDTHFFDTRAWSLEVCGYTRTRGYTRPDPYPRVWVGSGRCLTGRVWYRYDVNGRVGTGSPGHRVIIVTRYETRVFSNFRTNAQNAQLTF